MKNRFSSLDIGVIVKELKRYLGLRVVNVYDIDSKTYLIKISRPDEKAIILLESGVRLHSTTFDWPKNPAPSGFSMKMRKHLKNRRFESIDQLGVDRIVDMQFGSAEAAYHVILELYDRGNIVLTDYEYTILNILRTRTDDSQDVRFAVRESYPVTIARTHDIPTEDSLLAVLSLSKQGDSLRRLLVSHLDYGPAVIEHCLLEVGLPGELQIDKKFDIKNDVGKLLLATQVAETLVTSLLTKACKGYIFMKVEKRAIIQAGDPTELTTYDQFHPYYFQQISNRPMQEFDMFDKAVDEFFSKLQGQKLDVKMLNQEKAALKKLDNVKKDHEKRIDELQRVQEVDVVKGHLIEMNLELVDNAITVVRSALANQISWCEIEEIVKDSQEMGDPVASAIVTLKLSVNHITMRLRNLYSISSRDDDGVYVKPTDVDIDLNLSAYANSRKFFVKKKQAAKKVKKTIEASAKALKSAEKKTKESLKDMATLASINKTRKTYWFEKFLWFISSENFLVIGGRDQQQNELIVKRYMNSGDLYVHADLHGASSVVIKNPAGVTVPPKTLNEAGTMAICNSAAWDAKVITSAWYVNPDQISKTAPSGEYLTTGSFMIRGKKNYLPPSYLVYGFGFFFKLEEGSVERHLGERKMKTLAEDAVFSSEDTSLLCLNDDDDEEIVDHCGESSGDESNDGDECCGNDDDEGGASLKDILEEDVCEEESPTVDNERTTSRSMTGICDANVHRDVEFPDTSIQIDYISEDKNKYQLQTSSNTSVALSDNQRTAIHMPDTDASSQTMMLLAQRPGHLSAKKRRELHKSKRHLATENTFIEDEAPESSLHEGVKDAFLPQSTMQGCQINTLDETMAKMELMPSCVLNDQKPYSQQQLKRRQKSKLKKIRMKYADQDEEERKMKMEILASSGSPKGDRKKAKKNKVKPTRGQQKLQTMKFQGKSEVPLLISSVATCPAEDVRSTTKPVGFVSQVEHDDDSDVEADRIEEKEKPMDEMMMLNSLTGIPHVDDELLYAVSCCAPYSVLTAFKYKVKLVPGSMKKGKATKLALSTFQHDRNATTREKDLLRIMKDADLSRNMPGKVKVTAPSLRKT